ncbi:MAG: hypothetical protein WC389_13940 [Lutibacter sp.]|jgi:hypothetical protein
MKSQTIKFDRTLKALFEIFINEIQHCENLEQVNKVCKSWIDANDLHPELVKTFQSIGDLDEHLRETYEAKL